MKPVVSVAVMRESDAATIRKGVPSRELMARAARGVLNAYPWKGRTAIVCGNGNNAGDGYALALLLQRSGVSCRLLLLSDTFSDDGRYYFAQCKSAGIPYEILTEAPDFSSDAEIVDCLFGTGFHGNAEGLAAQVIEAINASGKPVISVDINSGMNGDSGLGTPAVRSALTVSVGTLKTGHYLGNAKDLIGSLVNVDIGIEIKGDCAWLPEEGDFGEILSPRRQSSHKGTYGYVGIMGGSTEYAGAVKLANMSAAALRAGCGVATLMVPASLTSAVSPYLLESTLAPLPDRDGKMIFSPEALKSALAHKKALAVGMGWGQSGEYPAILSYLTEHFDGSLVLDADALNTLSRMDRAILRRVSGRAVLTPHLAEFERLSGIPMMEIQSDPIRHAKAFAAEYGVILLLKGACTVVTDGKTVCLVHRGCAGMATAGSGDVLSGVLAGLLGFAPPTPLTVACGAYLAGLAGEIAERQTNPISMVSSDTVRALPEAVSRLLNACKKEK